MDKRFRINPRYQQGDAIRRNLREENLRRSYGLSTSYSEALPYTTQNVSTFSNTGIANEYYPTVGEEGKIIPAEELGGESIFSGPMHFLFGNYENAKERWDAASVKDAYRLWQEKRLQAEMTNRLNQINEAKESLNILDEAEKYAQMLDNRSGLLDKYQKAIQSGDTEQAMKAKDAYLQNEKNIIDFQERIKTTGKKNDINAQLFFDTDSAKAREYFKAFSENFGPDHNLGAWYNPITGLEEFSSTIGNIASSVQQGINRLINSSADGNYMRRAIRHSLENDRWTDPMFKDYDRDNLNGNGGNTQELRTKVKSMRDYWNREYDERVQAEKETANKYKNGSWYFDPQKINPKFRYYSENNDAGIIGGLLPDQLLYSIAETGSSYSDFVNMGAMMASDVAAGLLANRLATFAVKRNPYVNAVATINDLRKLRAAGKFEEAAKLAKAAERAQKIISSTNHAIATTDLGLKLGTTASNMFFINRMREHETNSEMIDAWSSRVLTKSMQGGADMPKVLEKTKEYLQDMGIDPTNMTDIDLVQHALAYDINTEDSVFEKEKEAGRQGLKKVYNDNMALAVKDYMEAMPFLGYSGSFLRSFGKGTVNKLADQTYQQQARTLFDRTISKLGSSGLNNIGNKLAAKHSLEYLTRVGKKLGYIGSLEAIEEGQQELLQSRYSRGLYDQYSQEQSSFPMASILEDVNLATDAVAAYMGWLPGDPDNGSHQLRRAMQIGGITGMLMGGGAFQAVSNIFPSNGKDNLRNLFAQIKNDKVMDILIGEHYGQAQDDKHLGIFYDALQKHGVSIDRLRKSVEDLKAFKGNQVTDEYIDRDVELLNNLYYIQEHPRFKKYLQEKDIAVGSKEHKQALIQSARKLTQLRDASRYIENDNHELDQIKNSTYREIMRRLDNPVGEAMDPEYDALMEMMWNSYQDYKNRRSAGRKKLQNIYDSLQKNENAQDWQLSKAKEDLDNYDAEHEHTYLEYVEQYLNHLYSSRFVLNSEDLLQRLKDRKTLLEEISKELGIDVSTSRLGSMIKSIEKTESEMLKLFDDDMSKVMNDAIAELNKKAKPGQKKIPFVQNVAKRLEKQYGRLPAQDEFNRIQRRMILNRSVYDSIEPVANAILKGKIDPRVALESVTQLSWKQLPKEEQDLFLKQINEQREKDGKKPLTNKGIVFEYNKQQADKLKKLRDLSEQYTKHLHEHTDQDDTVSNVDVDAESMQKEAADLLFDYEMQFDDELKRVNHREYLRQTASPSEVREQVDGNNTDAINVQNQDFDAVIQQFEGENTNAAQQQPTNKENTDEIIDYAAENTDAIQDFIGENTDAVDGKKEKKRTIMSDDERALREKLGMLEENTDGVQDSSKEENTDEVDDEDLENTDDSDQTQSNAGENTDAVIDLANQSTDAVPDGNVFENNERFVSTPNQIYTDFLGQTFKYDPRIDKTPDWIAGIRNEDNTVTPIIFKNNGKLKSPAQLAQKLIIPGWFDKADKYFVITADKTKVVDVKNPDNLVVALILQDGEDVYATFLTGLATYKGYDMNGERDIRNKMDQMFWSSFEYSNKKYVVKDEKGIHAENVSFGTFISRRNAYLQYHIGVDPATLKYDDEGKTIVNKWYQDLDIETKNRVDLITRSFLSGGRSVHSNENIEAQIANLRNTRNQIIDALLDKDADGDYVLKADPTQYKQGSPLNPRISDGKINDKYDGVDPVFRSLLDGGFGMSSDLEELTEQIDKEEVRLGVGRGERAFAPNKIDKLNTQSQGDYSHAGTGKAGKIYFIAETVNGNDRAIQLAERKFKDTREDVNPASIEFSFNTDGTLKENATPSIAEFILYLISDRIDNSVFDGISIKYISALKEALIGNEENEGNGLIVNHGKSTWVTRKEERKFKHFAKKQFFINEEKGTLVIALEDINGVPRSTEFDISNGEKSIFFDETQRRIVIAAIANNLHWNTPWKLMTEQLDIGLLEPLRDYFIKNPKATEYKIAGIDDLTFKKSDLFNPDMSNKNVSLVAWMIGTKKLMTSVGDSIFYAPFVYCDGVKQETPAKNAAKTAEQKAKNKKKLSKKKSNLSSFGEDILKKLGYKYQDRQDNGNVKGGQDGWKVRLVIKNPETGNHYTQQEYDLNKDKYESRSSVVLEWLKKYFGLTEDNTEIQKPNRGGQGHYRRIENGKKTEPFKHLSGGEIGESDFTIYIGSKEDVLKFIQDVENSEISSLLAFGDNKTDTKFSNLIHGRVEGRSIGFSGYTLPEGLQKLLPNGTVVYKDDNVEILILDRLYVINDLKTNKLIAWNPVIKDGVNGYVFKNIKKIRQQIANDVYGEYITGSTEEYVPTLSSIQSRLSKFDSERIGNTVHITEMQESGEVNVYALFDIDAGTIEKPANEEDITNKLKDSVNRFVQYVKEKRSVDINVDDIEMPNSSDYDAVSSGQALFTASLLPDGKVVVMTESVDDIINLVQDNGYTVQGVFSEEPGEGVLNADKARKWIKDTLGLNDAQVIVTNAVLKSVSNKTVYGVMTVMNNILTDVVEGTFFLPKYGGSTIHYHEAFHYVNLLLHSRRKRQQIYEEYIKRHPEYKDFSKRRIEELLADDFAEYCKQLDEYEESLANKNIFSRWAIKLYNRFIEFIKQFAKKDQIKLLFDGIIKGNYKNQLIDQESLEDFQKAYNGEAYKKFYAEGATDDQIDNFKTISKYQQFYTVAENIAHGFIDFMNIKKAENISRINKESFERYLTRIRIANLRKKNPFVQDVVENPAAFINAVNALLKQYGVVGQNRKRNVKKVSDGEDQSNQQNRPDDSISQLSQLYDNYIINQKDNVAYRAKLFLTQIKDVEFVYNEQTGQKELQQKTDAETGLPLYVSFDDAWQRITKELHEVDSFEELMSEVQRLAKTKAFFAELYKNIASVGNDIQLQTQIYSTVNKHLTKVLQIQMQSDRKKIGKSKQYLDAIAGLEATISQKITQKYDQERILEIVNDSRIKARRMLPRDWSADFFSSAAIKYDEFYHIDKDYVKNVIKKKFDQIRQIISNAKHGDSKMKEEALDEVLPMLVALLNDMSIPFDDDVLMEYLMMHVPAPKGKNKNTKQNGDGIGINQLFDALDEITQDAKATKDKSANIAFFINTVFNSTHTPQIKVGRRITAGLNIYKLSKPKPLDEIYVGFGGEIEKMAIAYNNIHPSSRELSVTGPGGKIVYPIGENNFISDVTRWINKNYNDFVNKLANTTYARNSKILDVARIIIKNGKQGDLEFKLNVYVGMEDEKLKKGVDYFGINAMEDVISKMLLSNNNMIVLPTMADKKTYYVLELVSRKGNPTENVFNLPHDLLIERESEMFPGMKALRFSDETLDLFARYFLDELNSVEEYYNKDNISEVVKNKKIRKANYHGKVKNGRMDFSGNGGKFRYFYGLEFPGIPGEEINGLNLNQLLEYEYNLQKEAEDPMSGDGNWFYRTHSEEMDGFESVRRRLSEIRDYFVNTIEGDEGPVSQDAKQELYDAINKMLIRRVYDNMNKFSKPGITQLIKRQSYKDASNPDAIEEWHWSNRAIPHQLISEYSERFKKIGVSLVKSGDTIVKKPLNISSESSYGRSEKSDALMLSVIGNYTLQSIISIIEIEKVYSGDPAFYKWKYAKQTEHTVVNERVADLQILVDKDSDKIKRLGGLLSPGAELRTDFSKEEYERFPWLRGTKYVNATIKDVIADSLYFDEVKDIFTRQLVADQLRHAGVDKRRIDEVYINDGAFKKEFNALSDEIKNDIKYQAGEQAKPYIGINVTDAQVFIRPDMYRKVRMMLGTWSVIPQKITYKTYSGETMTTTYSDNEAFEILENDGEWMLDPEKAAKVSRLQLYPLKMSYFKNDPKAITSGQNIAYSVYNKMAIFPAFKYIMRSETGRKIYDRMNDVSKGVLDMVTVESAVKVGMSQDAYKAYDSNTTSLATLNDSLNKPSACVLDGNNENWNDSNDVINVEVQDIRGLRMQLNTEAHLDEERNIGTQMFKILFGNIYDDEEYTGGDPNNKKRSGKDIRRDIMDCINALTDIGIKQLNNKFCGEDGNIDSEKVHKYFKQIAENNGLPNSVINLLNTSGTVESLMQRVLFEHSVSSLVNSYVIDIPTKGGSAVQQSVFGTVSYDSNQIRTSAEQIDGYWIPNDGKELNWNEKDGTMEVMLSLNFFKAVVPVEYQKSPKMMRNWLINHGVIKGFKAPDENGNREFSEGMVFGVGYRIPTQGMSSTFAFRVADVLPEQAGDVIIVPREFTAQTGSDFDVDKIYLATMSFKNGILEQVGENLESSTKGAISNKLLQNYITVLTDIKNRSNARGSIDVVTNIIQDSTLPAIRKSDNKYRESMYELDPYFQLRRKMEFSIGKSGIGPFALNITNLALTQFAHISIDYGENEFGFGKLDEVVGQDGIRISDWLSAMINAHVDVAKDPYVFDLNVNSCTYNITNFLLRAGKGESTFLFLAQPALKEFADEYNNSGGLYGQNLKYEAEKESKYKLIYQKINEYAAKLSNAINNIKDKETKKIWKNSFNKIKSGEYDNWSIVFDKNAAKEALKNPQSLKGLQFQLLSLMAFNKITPYAEEMSELVKKSRIDTKKFGNTLALRRDFVNEYKKFKYGERDVKWVNTDNSTQNPLHKYFESTFLEKKLYASINMMNKILKNDIVTASEEFDSIVNTIFGEIYGFTSVTDTLGNKMHPYETVFDKQSVQNISNELENTFRHKMLFMYGPQIYDRLTGQDSTKDSYDYYQQQKNRGYSGVIDFTFGGDEDIMLDELKRIWNGNPNSEDPYEQNSLFENIAEVINQLETSELEDRNGEFNGLVDENGRVINELLNYLRPQPANYKFDIPRLLLRKPNRNTVTSEKSRLISAFNFLLDHPLEIIRRLARDIAIYSYYSGYNTNSAHSFFDLVPVEYRKQYDEAIKEGVNNFSSSTVVQIGVENGVQDYKQDCKPLIDVICKNFYSDDKIVPLFEFPKESAKDITGYRGTFAGRNVRSKRAKDVIVSWFATTGNNKPYLKIETNGETFLYRKIGFYLKHEGNEIKQDKNGELSGVKWYTYVLTEKLGIHNKNIHQYELFANADSDSIFDQNRLPDGFDIVNVEADLLQVMNKSQQLLDKRYTAKNNKNKKQIFIDFIPYNNLVVEDSSIRSDVDIKGGSSIIYAKNADEYINEHSDTVIDLNTFNDEEIQIAQTYSINGQQDSITIGFTNSEEISKNTEKIDDTISKLFIQLSNIDNIESVLLPNNEFGLRFKEIYNNSDNDFIENLYTVSQEAPEKTNVVSKKKKDQLKLQDDIIDGAQSMDAVLNQATDKSNNTDSLQESVSFGPDVINDQPQTIIRGSIEELREMLKQHNKSLKESNKAKSSVVHPKFYSGKITPSDDVIFVFGSNPEGRHGSGAAKVAKEKFGAKYGQGEGLQGNSYALPTKDLRVKKNRGLRSISGEQIIENIKKLYDVARQNPNKRFMIAYTNLENETTLNGYTGKEMANMFKQAGQIPENVEFSENWKFAWNDDQFNTKC